MTFTLDAIRDHLYFINSIEWSDNFVHLGGAGILIVECLIDNSQRTFAIGKNMAGEVSSLLLEQTFSWRDGKLPMRIHDKIESIIQRLCEIV